MNRTGRPKANPPAREVHLSYRQGTLTLEFQKGVTRPADLPEMTWDPRVGLYRAPAYRYGSLRERLLRSGLGLTDEVCGWKQSPPPKLPHLDRLNLRPYQEESVWAWEMAGSRGVVALPTGSGKTHVALAAMARCGLPTLILAPTRALVGQWKKILQQTCESDVGQVGDGMRDVRDLTVCTFESAYRHLDRFGRRFGLLVVDEAHHFGSPMRAEALEMAPAPFRLGLTATPATDPEPAARLERLLGPTVFCLAVTDLTGRYLADFDTVVLPVRLDPGEELEFQKEQAVFLAAFRRFKVARPLGTWPEFVEWARTDRAGLRALAAYHRSRAILSFPSDKRRMLSGLLKRNAHRRVLVFTRDNEAAYGISTEHLIPAITCDIKRKERTAVLESFRRGRVRALVSARVLNEGLDLPEAQVAIIVGGAGGTREFVQRVGRVLRPRPGKQAVVYQLVVQQTAEARLFRKGSEALSQPVRVTAPAPAPGTDPAPVPARTDGKAGCTCYPRG